MTFHKWMPLAALCLLAATAASAAPRQAGQATSTACSATVADHATIAGSEAAVGTDIYSGELLQTSNDGSLMVQCKTVRLALASNSSMRIFQSDAKTSVELERGIVTYSTGGFSEDLTLYSLDVKIVPETKQPTIGQVDVSSRCELAVQSTKGKVAVTSDKETKIVEESKAYDVTPKIGVDYSDNWQPVLNDYPDFPRQAKYHDSHHHVPCAAAPPQNASVKPPMDPEVFREIAVGGLMAGTGIILWHFESESPYKPHRPE
jgi:hypothetical protein